MKIGPKYKIARRLGAGVFDKTSTAKFAASAARKSKNSSKRPKAKSDFGLQMLEKQKARFSYGMNERQFSRYVKNSITQKKTKPEDKLFELLETRLDNVIYRLGLANSRRFARQIVSHGHIVVNGIKVTIPSYNVSLNDKIAIRGGSQANKVFEKASDKLKAASIPNWLKVDPEKKEASVQGSPRYEPSMTIFDIAAILEFYKR
jgi:small subunit ribosomal protein S4